MKTKENLYLFFISHIIETLLYNDKVKLINYIYSLSVMPSLLEISIKNYFDENIIEVDSNKYLIFCDYKKDAILDEIQKILIFINGKWQETNKLQKDTFFEEEDVLKFDNKNYNELVGFIGYKKGTEDILVFKTKLINNSRDTGARCDEKNKGNTIVLFNKEILNIFTNENTKKITVKQLCVYEEFILRYFNQIHHNGKKWFLTPELAIIYFQFSENKKMKHKDKKK
jgi:hypothetical protein